MSSTPPSTADLRARAAQFEQRYGRKPSQRELARLAQAAAGRAWAAAGLGRVIGITPSQSARNTLAAGVPESPNCAQFLGHLPG